MFLTFKVKVLSALISLLLYNLNLLFPQQETTIDLAIHLAYNAMFCTTVIHWSSFLNLGTVLQFKRNILDYEKIMRVFEKPVNCFHCKIVYLNSIEKQR